MTHVVDHCTRCGKEMLLSPELAEWVGGCVVCDDCPFEEPPCETCGDEDCGCECCDCTSCVNGRKNCERGWCTRVFELCDKITMARIMRDMMRVSVNKQKAFRLLTQMFGVP
jgi:hypothetical protein